jgi:hypothetical protein
MWFPLVTPVRRIRQLLTDSGRIPWRPIVRSEDWRADKREAILERVAKSEVIERETGASPSGKYRMGVSELRAADTGWYYSVGTVSLASGHEITFVERNYSTFPYTWVETHPNGHDYLVCGEDYQGQTIIELGTGRRVDHLPESAQSGFGFCWAAHYPSLDRRFVAVDGCYWACPNELVIYDFTQPMELPYRELHRAPVWEVHDGGFLPDGSISWSSTDAVRKSDGKPIDDLDEAEDEALLDEDRRYRMELLDQVTFRRTWRPDSTIDVQRIPQGQV